MIRNHIWLLNNALKMRILNPVGDDNKQTEKSSGLYFHFFSIYLSKFVNFFLNFTNLIRSSLSVF